MKSKNKVSAAAASAAFVVTFVTVVCLVWWPLPTAAAVLAASGVWVAKKP